VCFLFTKKGVVNMSRFRIREEVNVYPDELIECENYEGFYDLLSDKLNMPSLHDIEYSIKGYRDGCLIYYVSGWNSSIWNDYEEDDYEKPVDNKRNTSNREYNEY
jgi:hypothetical protein